MDFFSPCFFLFFFFFLLGFIGSISIDVGLTTPIHITIDRVFLLLSSSAKSELSEKEKAESLWKTKKLWLKLASLLGKEKKELEKSKGWIFCGLLVF